MRLLYMSICISPRDMPKGEQTFYRNSPLKPLAYCHKAFNIPYTVNIAWQKKRRSNEEFINLSMCQDIIGFEEILVDRTRQPWCQFTIEWT